MFLDLQLLKGTQFIKHIILTKKLQLRLLAQILVNSKIQKFKFLLINNLSARIHSGISCNYRIGALPQDFGKT